jgi:hypothetical protein
MRRRRWLGDSYRLIIISMHNLATTLSLQGKLEEAEALLIKALLEMKRIQGSDHSDTQIIRKSLAAVLPRLFSTNTHYMVRPISSSILPLSEDVRNIWCGASLHIDEHEQPGWSAGQIGQVLGGERDVSKGI